MRKILAEKMLAGVTAIVMGNRKTFHLSTLVHLRARLDLYWSSLHYSSNPPQTLDRQDKPVLQYHILVVSEMCGMDRLVGGYV